MGRIFKFALALFLIGVGVIAVFSVVAEESIFTAVNEDDYEYVELTYSADDFSGLDFDFDNRDFYVLVSNDDQIKVTFYKTEKENVSIDDDGETLSISHETVWYEQIFQFVNIFADNEYLDVFVYLPVTVIYDLDLHTTNGILDIKNFDNLDSIKFRTANGRIVVDNVSCGSMDLFTSNGEIRVTDTVVSNDLELDTLNGGLDLTDINADTVDVHTSNGKIEIASLVSSNTKIGTSNGVIEISDVTSSIIKVSSSNKRISASNIVSDDITINTSNGNITLTVIGNKDDYEVHMDTSNGDLNYDGINVADGTFNQGAAKEIDLDSSNGDVSVEFID